MFGTDLLAPSHILLILVVALIVLGPKRLPEVGRSLGRGLRDFRSGLQGAQDEARGMFHEVLDEPQPPEDTTVSTAPEPMAPAAEEPLVAPSPMPVPAAATVTKVVPADPDPADFAD